MTLKIKFIIKSNLIRANSHCSIFLYNILKTVLIERDNVHLRNNRYYRERKATCGIHWDCG